MINTTAGEKGWLIHRFPIRDHLYLLYILTPERVLKAFYRRRSGQPLPQIFLPYWWSWTSKQENHQIRHLEILGPGLDLVGLKLFVGLYMNELIFHLGRQADLIPNFYAQYEAILQDEQPFQALPLRQFEWQLLADCGYAIDFSKTRDSHRIQADATYQFYPEQGFCLASKGFGGATLLAIHQGQYDNQSLGVLKKIFAAMIDYLLDGRVLHSRELFLQWKQAHTN